MKIRFNLKEIRKEKKISQNELSRISSVGLQSITRIEKGNAQEVSIITILKLAKALDVKLEELFEIEE